MLLRLTGGLVVWKPHYACRSRVVPMFGRSTGCHDRLVTLSVLLVDDDPDFLTLAARVVEANGARVVATAQDADSAITAAKETAPQAALVDVGLPDRNGFDLGA